MSVSTDYQMYVSTGGTLLEAAYATHLNDVKNRLGSLINEDPKNTASDIGKRIVSHLGNDLPSMFALSRASKGLNDRSKHRWFVLNSREIVLKYVQCGTSYPDYLYDGGWKDFILVGAKATCVALTIAGGG